MMKIIDIAGLRPPSGGSPRFKGADHEASVSFFVVASAPEQGADKYRRPYEEVFVILDGDIEAIIIPRFTLEPLEQVYRRIAAATYRHESW